MITRTRAVAICAALAFAPLVAHAAEIVARPTLTLEGAKSVAAAAIAEAKKLNAPGGTVAVVDAGGQTLYLERLDNTFAKSAEISQGKARTAAVFKKATADFEDIVNKGRTSMTALGDFTPLKGGVPLAVDGVVVGAVGVSGAASADQDDQVARAAAAAFAASVK
jgi:glc operon protein GlcG